MPTVNAMNHLVFRHWRGIIGRTYPASTLHKSTAGRYRPVSYPDGPITARYKFIKNAYWVSIMLQKLWQFNWFQFCVCVHCSQRFNPFRTYFSVLKYILQYRSIFVAEIKTLIILRERSLIRVFVCPHKVNFPAWKEWKSWSDCASSQMGSSQFLHIPVYYKM